MLLYFVIILCDFIFFNENCHITDDRFFGVTLTIVLGTMKFKDYLKYELTGMLKKFH